MKRSKSQVKQGRIKKKDLTFDSWHVCTNRAVDQIDYNKIGLGESQRETCHHHDRSSTHIYIYIYRIIIYI